MYTAALVGTDGSIDWYCIPHFDSPSVFAAILDDKKGGFFKIAPCQDYRRQQFYYPETNVLITRFLERGGVGELIDFMPVADGPPTPGGAPRQLIRRLSCVRGSIRFRLECRPAFDYARQAHILEIGAKGAVFRSGATTLGLHSPLPLTEEGTAAISEFSLAEGETVTFMLVNRRKGEDPLLPTVDGERAYAESIRFWRNWLSQCTYSGRWREMVYRSALTLKLLTFEPTGAMVAAPTSSLPEEIGGSRNWDYRYTWIRDTSFSIYALLRIGFTREAERFTDWLVARTAEQSPDGPLRIAYGIDGRGDLREEVLDHLEGYMGSGPVRIGNMASNQLQLDIYGEAMDAIYLSNKYGKPVSPEVWETLRLLLDWVSENWQRPDAGIWEFRGELRHFLFSKIMCWVALDRGIRLAQQRKFPADLPRWEQARDRLYEEVMRKGWSDELGSFVQYYGGKELDAGNLIMPLVFFISPKDPRMEATLEQTLKHLTSDSLVFRYRSRAAPADDPDAPEGEEGTFTMCTFWLVEALTRSGRLDEARLIFEKMLSYANHLGLYSEEISSTGELLGNFPQAFSHFALISAAYNLDREINRGARP